MAEYSPSQKRAVNTVISSALRDFKSHRRHPCEVTSDRLGDHLARYGDRLSGADRDLFSHVRHLLEGLAESSGDGGQDG